MAATSHLARILVVEDSEHGVVLDQRNRFLQLSQAVAKVDTLVVLQTHRKIGKKRPASLSQGPAAEEHVEMVAAVDHRILVRVGWTSHDFADRPGGAGKIDLAAERVAIGKGGKPLLGGHAGVARHVGELAAEAGGNKRRHRSSGSARDS